MSIRGICPAPGGQDGVGDPHTERTLTARLRDLLALVMCVCLTLPLIPAPAQAAETPATSWTDANNYNIDWYGKDTDTSFTISTAAELAGLAKLSENNNFSGKTVTLTADVDLSAHLWPGIDDFHGTFHGGNHTISGMVMNKTEPSAELYAVGGLFVACTQGGRIKGIRLYKPYIKLTGISVCGGALIGLLEGYGAYDCEVIGPKFEITLLEGSSDGVYVGGLLGRSVGNTMIMNNCIVSDLSVTVIGTPPTDKCEISGLGKGPAYNCFVTVDTITKNDAIKFSYTSVTGYGENCYWLDTGLTDTPSATMKNSYPVTEEQVKGTSSKPIAGDNTYANTPSLATAMKRWIDAKNGADITYREWTSDELAALLPIHYLDISGPLDEVTHQSATGDIDVGMDLEGQIQEQVTLLSVTLPASIPFIVDVETDGAFKRVLSATGTLANRSDCEVNITLTAVTDEGELLKKVALSLISDPAPSAGTPQIALVAGTGKTDLLAALAAPAEDGTPTTATLKVDGTAKPDVASIGNDGEQFVVGLTLKVSKQQK